jgi:hypothetical protein
MMELSQARALAMMEEGQREYTRNVLHDSGYGDLAEQWLTAETEFEIVAKQTPEEDMVDREVRSNVVRAYARRCVSWARISQLRDQAVGQIETLSR